MKLSPGIGKVREKARQVALRRVRSDFWNAPAEFRPIFETIASELLNPQLNVAFVKRRAGVSQHACTKFSAWRGVTVEQYLINLRQIMAEWLLTKTQLPIWAVAEALNYTAAANFSTDFRRWTGRSPTSYRRVEGFPALPDPYRRVRIRRWMRGRLYRLGPQAERELAETVWRSLREETRTTRRRLLEGDLVASSPVLFELLSEKSREAGYRNLRLGVELAEDALVHVEASELLLGDGFGRLHALALARLGNAERLTGDLARAQKLFEDAWQSWAEARYRGRAIEAEILDLEASLRLFQRNYPAALEALDRSSGLAEEIGHVGLQVSAHLQRAAVYGYSGDPRKALPELEAASQKLSRGQPGDRLGLLFVRQDLLLAYIQTDELSKAAKLLPGARALAGELDHAPSQHRLAWIEGLFRKKKGDGASAERLLRQARAGLAEQGDPGSAAVVGLDLAIFCQERGRGDEARRLVADEVLPALASLRIHPEALAASNLLQASLEAEITSGALQKAQELLCAFHLVSPR